MALTKDEIAYLDRLKSAGADKENMAYYLKQRRGKEAAQKPGLLGKIVQTGQDIGAGAIQAGGELAVGLPGQLSRLLPGNQSADKNSFYNKTQRLLESTKQDMAKEGIDTESNAFGLGKGVMNIAASTLGTSYLPKIPQATSLIGKTLGGAATGAIEGAAYDAATGNAPGVSTAGGALLGGAIPLGGAIVKGVGSLIGKYGNKLPVNTSKIGAYTEGKLGKLAGEAADNLSTKFNRLDPAKEIEFKKMTGDTVGGFLNNRGINTAGTDTVGAVSDLFQKSIKEADDGLALIKGTYKMKGGDDYIGIAIGDLQKKLSSELSKDRGLINSLALKYNNEGLTQTEINQLKRLYQQNNRFGYLKEAIDPSGVARATNILDGIRDFQFTTAAKNGFTNLSAINKNTQAYKFISKELSKKLDKASANNAISLTDWIVATGSPYGFGGVVAKKLISSDTAKGLILKGLASGKKTISPIEKASKASIIEEQVKKVYGLSDNSYSDLNFSSTLDRKGIRTLPPPSGKPLTNSGIIDVNPITTGARGANPSDITSRSKIVKPGTYTETPLKKGVKATVIPKTSVKAKLRTNEDALRKPNTILPGNNTKALYELANENPAQLKRMLMADGKIGSMQADDFIERAKLGKVRDDLAENIMKTPKIESAKVGTGNSYIDYFNKNEPYGPSESKFLESVKGTPEGTQLFKEIERTKMPRFTVSESQNGGIKLTLDDGYTVQGMTRKDVAERAGSYLRKTFSEDTTKWEGPKIESKVEMKKSEVDDWIEKKFGKSTPQSKSSLPMAEKSAVKYSEPLYKNGSEFEDAVKKQINKVFILNGRGLEDVSIIGSTARGKLKPNDLDILVTPKKKYGVLRSEDVHDRIELQNLIKDEIQSFFPDKKIHITISEHDIKRGPKISISDLYNKK